MLCLRLEWGGDNRPSHWIRCHPSTCLKWFEIVGDLVLCLENELIIWELETSWVLTCLVNTTTEQINEREKEKRKKKERKKREERKKNLTLYFWKASMCRGHLPLHLAWALIGPHTNLPRAFSEACLMYHSKQPPLHHTGFVCLRQFISHILSPDISLSREFP